MLKPPRVLFRAAPETAQTSIVNEAPARIPSQTADAGGQSRQTGVIETTPAAAAEPTAPKDPPELYPPIAVARRPKSPAAPARLSNPESIEKDLNLAPSVPSVHGRSIAFVQPAHDRPAPDVVQGYESTPSRRVQQPPQPGESNRSLPQPKFFAPSAQEIALDSSSPIPNRLKLDVSEVGVGEVQPLESKRGLEPSLCTIRPVPPKPPPALTAHAHRRSSSIIDGVVTPPLDLPVPPGRRSQGAERSSERASADHAVVIRSLEVRLTPPLASVALSRQAPEPKALIPSLSRGFPSFGLFQSY